MSDTSSANSVPSVDQTTDPMSAMAMRLADIANHLAMANRISALSVAVSNVDASTRAKTVNEFRESVNMMADSILKQASRDA